TSFSRARRAGSGRVRRRLLPWPAVLRRVSLAACMLLASGCYRSHLFVYEGSSDGGGVDATAPHDALPPPIDVGPPPRDAGRDGGFDAGRDGGFDAGRDAGRDGGHRDAGPDAARDAGPPPIDSGPHRPALRFSRTTFFGVGDAPSFDLTGDSVLEV